MHVCHAAAAFDQPIGYGRAAAGGLERDAVFVYISFKFLVGLTKSGPPGPALFCLPAGRI